MIGNKEMYIGRIVLAKAGRDKGHLFVIVGQINENYVLIANGINRTIEDPKRKNIKHIELRPDYLENIREKIIRGQKVFDPEIRKGLEAIKNTLK